MILRDKRGRFIAKDRVKGAHVDVYRLEHTTCDRAGHGPFIRNGCGFPFDFGLSGKCPDMAEIETWESCGVTGDQAPYWWGYAPRPADLAEAEERGWNFVHYSVPVEECREHRGQIIFVARPEYRVGVLPADNPLVSAGCATDDQRWEWHGQHFDITRPGYALVA